MVSVPPLCALPPPPALEPLSSLSSPHAPISAVIASRARRTNRRRISLLRSGSPTASYPEKGEENRAPELRLRRCVGGQPVRLALRQREVTCGLVSAPLGLERRLDLRAHLLCLRAARVEAA